MEVGNTVYDTETKTQVDAVTIILMSEGKRERE